MPGLQENPKMKKMPFPLVVPLDGEARASSEIIAHGVGVYHKNLLAMVRKYESDLSEFGPIAFQTRLAKTPRFAQRSRPSPPPFL